MSKNLKIPKKEKQLYPFFVITVIPCTGMLTLKPKHLEIDATLNVLFVHFWITGLMPHLKPETIKLF